MQIGKNRFTSTLNGNGFDELRSFQITNCEELESITIGDYSFSDYNEFELRNLYSLDVITLDSYSFYSSSFVIRGRFDL